MPKNLLHIVFLLLSLSGCHNVVLVVEGIPESTPDGASIFVAGNFNYWDPGDGRYVLSKNEEGDYIANMPFGIGALEYKFTRGDWTTVEAGICGDEIANRMVEYGDDDTVRVKIESWKDRGPTNCPEVTLVVDKLPEEHQYSEPIYVAGNFNLWNPKDEDWRMHQDSTSGKYTITIPRPNDFAEIQFKLTRGDWETVEVDEEGYDLENRYFTFGRDDTLYIEVANWADRMSHLNVKVTFLVKSLPSYTPKDASIYLACNHNAWNPMDKKSKLDRNDNGTYAIEVYHKRGTWLAYKFTRGGWNKVETNSDGNDIDNRHLLFDYEDTVEIKIENWRDRESIEQ
ncbi:hypothetical protein V6R21_14130 [Limibacter armeniacum]|uniref:hypothetical protein n=1 Tax=Limibacter armeniacum TaxID=466084 RepID=UPI002FE68BAF